jgi:DNA-binding MarR family transcriptional regulator
MPNKEHSITDPIIVTASRLEAVANRYVFHPLGTSSTSMKIMHILDIKKTVAPGKLLEYVGGTKANISQHLKALEKIGFIERRYESDKNDRRKVAVSFSAKGRRHFQKIHGEIHRRMRKAHLVLEDRFSAREIKQHCKFFKKLNEILDDPKNIIPKLFDKK